MRLTDHGHDNVDRSGAAVRAEADRARTEASNRLRMVSGRALLRDAQSYERPGPRMRIPRNGAVYNPSSLSRSFTDVSGSEEAYRHSMPTPPYTSNDISSQTSPGANPLNPLGSASLTPHFAPAYRYDSPNTANLSAPTFSMSSHAIQPNPLRRFGHRSITDSNRQENTRLSRRAGLYVDGLGDRERSLTPEDEGGSWDTLLTTIAPDEHLPSASSSFTSTATASLSTNSASTSSSLNTALTAPSSTDAIMPFPICDMTDSSDDDDDDNDGGSCIEMEGDNWQGADQRDDEHDGGVRAHPRPPATTSTSIPISHAHPHHHNHLHSSHVPTDAEVEALISQHTIVPFSPIYPSESQAQTLDMERLEPLQAVLASLVGRDDIPESWWYEAGLTRHRHGDDSPDVDTRSDSPGVPVRAPALAASDRGMTVAGISAMSARVRELLTRIERLEDETSARLEGREGAEEARGEMARARQRSELVEREWLAATAADHVHGHGHVARSRTARENSRETPQARR